MAETEKKKAVVLLSGGLDSATASAMAKEAGFSCYALTFAYGQRHEVELLAARRVAEHLNVAEVKTVTIDLRAFGGSALTDDIAVPRDDLKSSGIPVTYVPARNTIFLGYALAWAEVLGSRDIFIGVNAVDYSGYPDCRPEFIAAFEKLANLATRVGVEGKPIRIHAPLINMSKAEIIRRGTALGVDYSLTHSCYDPDEAGRACGHCDSCLLRREGFREAGIPDPTIYREGVG
ncbi:MAG TPA: 7-cyano-7-deazaguanine synthase QueC [Phycisphaeraceae bacterium]|nr:7-cyano-7-deazaguanine synthase QueC [Phycisphaeraceae bacterium]